MTKTKLMDINSCHNYLNYSNFMSPLFSVHGYSLDWVIYQKILSNWQGGKKNNNKIQALPLFCSFFKKLHTFPCITMGKLNII